MTDPGLLDHVRSILEKDRSWALYALGDLEPEFQADCRWEIEGESLILVYSGLTPPVLFAAGDPMSIDRLMDRMEFPKLSLSIRPDVLSAVKRLFRSGHIVPMWRMILTDSLLATSGGFTVRLRETDLAALQVLYQDGDTAGEAPDAFQPSMLSRGVYFGAWEANELIAAAGTHLVSDSYRVAAVGNVYTRRDRRGRGLGASVTAAVAAELRTRGISTIGLNVRQDNAPAIRAYEKIGFIKCVSFLEGEASRTSAPPSFSHPAWNG